MRVSHSFSDLPINWINKSTNQTTIWLPLLINWNSGKLDDYYWGSLNYCNLINMESSSVDILIDSIIGWSIIHPCLNVANLLLPIECINAIHVPVIDCPIINLPKMMSSPFWGLHKYEIDRLTLHETTMSETRSGMDEILRHSCMSLRAQLSNTRMDTSASIARKSRYSRMPMESLCQAMNPCLLT